MFVRGETGFRLARNSFGILGTVFTGSEEQIPAHEGALAKRKAMANHNTRYKSNSLFRVHHPISFPALKRSRNQNVRVSSPFKLFPFSFSRVSLPPSSYMRRAIPLASWNIPRAGLGISLFHQYMLGHINRAWFHLENMQLRDTSKTQHPFTILFVSIPAGSDCSTWRFNFLPTILRGSQSYSDLSEPVRSVAYWQGKTIFEVRVLLCRLPNSIYLLLWRDSSTLRVFMHLGEIYKHKSVNVKCL